jgi:hypothetical protein
MAGKGKGFVWLDYLTVYENVWRNGTVSLDTIVYGNEESQPGHLTRFLDLLVDGNPGQEETAIKRDMFLKLSEEAKEIIMIVLEGPKETIEAITSEKYNVISKQRIKKYLEKKGWKRKTVNRCFEELKVFAEGID